MAYILFVVRDILIYSWWLLVTDHWYCESDEKKKIDSMVVAFVMIVNVFALHWITLIITIIVIIIVSQLLHFFLLLL